MDNKFDWLPQLGENNIDYILQELDNYGVGYKIDKYSPEDIKMIKDFPYEEDEINYFNDKINQMSPMSPLFISVDNEVLDGHKRLSAYQQHPSVNKIFCVKLFMDSNNSARVLNKIQDKYDWEVENEFQQGYDSDTNVSNEPSCGCDSDVQETIIDSNEQTKNPMTVKGYRSKIVNNETKNGNYFLLNKKPKFVHEYDLEFDNVLDIPEEKISDDHMECMYEALGLTYENVMQEAEKNGLTKENYMLNQIVKECNKKGYDGIKVGNKYVLGI